MLRRYRTKLFFLLVLLLTSSLFVSNMKVGVIKPVDTSSPSQSAGWLTGWQYRKSHTIQGAVGAGTNYQVRIIVHRLTGTDSGENVYVGTKCKSDFGDIRFTDADGVTVLNSWLQEYDSTQAVFWVRIADNLEIGCTYTSILEMEL